MSGFALVILAAGRSTRMGGDNKLLADLGGAPLVARTVANALRSNARPVIVVTGHMERAIRDALGAQSGAMFVHNPDYESGMASSLETGLGAVPADADGAIILLGDMPFVGADVIDRLTASAAVAPDKAAIVPSVEGEWAHPVLLRRRLFPEVTALTGDSGARKILAARADVATLAFDEPGLLMDADDPSALARVRTRFAGDDRFK